MTSLLDLPAAAFVGICAYLNENDIIHLRVTCGTAQSKTRPAFVKLFTAVKISLYHHSVEILEALSRVDDIAAQIECLMIGTEALVRNFYV